MLEAVESGCSELSRCFLAKCLCAEYHQGACGQKDLRHILKFAKYVPVFFLLLSFAEFYHLSHTKLFSNIACLSE